MDSRSSQLTEITFHLIVESSPNAVLLVNREGTIAYVNRQCEELFGYTAGELISSSVEKLIPERLRANHPALRNSFFQAPSMRAMGVGRELFAQRRDGSEFPVEIGLNPLVLVDGTWVLVTILDITERKLADARFRQVVHSAPSAIILVNREGIITLANHQVTQLFGYEEQEMLNQPVEMLLPERYRGEHGGWLAGYFARPQARYMGTGRDLLGRHKDGWEIPIEIGLNPLDVNGDVMVLAAIIDITERKAQEELRAKKEAAEAAYKAKGELLAIASHDLKNPLASITGLAEILLEMKRNDPGASQQTIEFLQAIHDASSHMSEVVKGILSTEGLEQSGLSLVHDWIDVSELCLSLFKFNTHAAMKKNITLRDDIAAGIFLMGDKTRLREAFDNYLSNAIKYSPPGLTVEVTLKVVPGDPPGSGTQLEFGVRDQGPGLTDDDKAKLFGKFRKLSARPTAGESSTGLGLSIVKSIVELHHGTVGCDSTLGLGAYFWARIPLPKKAP